MEGARVLLHCPWVKLPQAPRGVPKLANFIEEMSWLGKGHSRNSTGPDFLPVFWSELHMSTGCGWDSETWAHKLPICLVAKAICVGSPPISSNKTRVLPLGFYPGTEAHDTYRITDVRTGSLKELLLLVLASSPDTYSCWDGLPQFLRHLFEL